jgi:hypothetical protein
MSKVVDKAKVQQALNRAAVNAKRGSSEVRAGKFLVRRDKGAGQLGMRRDVASARPGAKKT